MLPTTFKTGKPIDFNQLLKTYIIKNYDASCYSQPVQAFIAEFQQNRNVVVNLNDTPKGYEGLKTNKDILIAYINNLTLIKSKMNFGKDEFSIKVEFSWKDTIKNSNWSSYNISLEFFSNLFNLGIMFYLLGNTIVSEANDDELKLKEAIKYYQHAAATFDTLKNDVPGSIPGKETPPDLTANYLTYCSYICLAQGQICLLKVAEKKGSSFELQAQLSKGIYDLFASAYNMTNESLKKVIDEEMRIYINNRRFYYVALSFIKMKEQTMVEFNKTGENYGKALAYQAYGVDSLLQGNKDAKKIKNLLDLKSYEDFLAKQQAIGEEMYEKNQRIYFNSVPELQDLSKLEKKLMVNPALPPEIKLVAEGTSALDELVPKEVKGMIESYKIKMMNFISENLSNYENESTVTAFLTELNLPFSLESILSQTEISESLWRKISEVQQKGGTLFLTNTIAGLQKKSEEIEKRINDAIVSLRNEEEEDSKYQQIYKNRWTRLPSSSLNGNYMNTMKEYLNKLAIAKNCDAQVKAGILDNMKYFELLTLSRQSLNAKIPQKVDANSIKNCNEATTLRKDLDQMESLVEKCMEIINKIFQTLNEDNVVPQFIKILQKKTTENAIFAENKAKYDVMFKELEAVSEEIKLLKLSIKTKNEVFCRVKQSTFKVSDENEKFFRDLETFSQLYHQKLIMLQQGLNFYAEFNRKLNELNTIITDHLWAREMDKNELINFLTGGGIYNSKSNDNKMQNSNQQFSNNLWDLSNNAMNQKYLSSSTFLDPNRNRITQMNAGVNTTSVNPNITSNYHQGMNPNFQNFPSGQNYNVPPQNFNFPPQGFNPPQNFNAPMQNYNLPQNFNNQMNLDALLHNEFGKTNPGYNNYNPK